MKTDLSIPNNGMAIIRSIPFAASASTSREPFIDANQAAKLLSLSPKTLLRFARQGTIPAHPLTGKTRRQWRFLESELYAWAQERLNLRASDPCLNSRRR